MLVNTGLSYISGYTRLSSYSVNERLSLSRVGSDGADANPGQDTLTLSDQAKAALLKGADKVSDVQQAESTNPQANFIRTMLEKAIGVQIGDIDIEELDFSSTNAVYDSTQVTAQQDAQSALLSYQKSHMESSQTTLSMEGTIRTKDGQELAFDLDLSVSKSLASQTSVSVQAQQSQTDASQPQAPIQIDFDGLASDLKSLAFSFAPADDSNNTGGGLMMLKDSQADGPKRGHAYGHTKHADENPKLNQTA